LSKRRWGEVSRGLAGREGERGTATELAGKQLRRLPKKRGRKGETAGRL